MRVAVAQSEKVFRLGRLSIGPPIGPSAGPGAVLIKGMEQRGYSLGKNSLYEPRGAFGKMARLPQLMQEFKTTNVEQ